MKKSTNLKDKNGDEIMDGDFVSLGENMTADDSLGDLPNGWAFDENDIYKVYFDERIQNWSLRMNIDPTSPFNCKFMNHAVSLLHSGDVLIVVVKQPDTIKG